MVKLSDLVNQVESRVTESPDREITTTEVGEFLMDTLRGIDKIAYVRFASVYRDFQDEQAFLNELKPCNTGGRSRLCLLAYSNNMEVQLSLRIKRHLRSAPWKQGACTSEKEAVQTKRCPYERIAKAGAWEFRWLRLIAPVLPAHFRGEGREITPETMRDMATEVKERGRTRLMAQLANTSLMAHRAAGDVGVGHLALRSDRQPVIPKNGAGQSLED